MRMDWEGKESAGSLFRSSGKVEKLPKLKFQLLGQ